MTTPPLVTIVIPTYNYGLYLVEAVRSAASQSYSHIEIIVVDDGSTDETAETLERLKDELPALQVITTEHQGVSHARNCGTRAGRGAYVAYLDADDLWHSSKIEKQVEAMAQLEGDPEWAAVYCLFRPIDEHGMIFGSAPAFNTRGYFFARHLVINPIGNGSGMMMRRDVILELGGFDPALTHCEDLDVQLRISKRYKIELVREYLVGYRQHNDSASTHHLRMAQAVMDVADKHTTGKEIPAELRKATFAAAHRYLWFKYLKGGAWWAGCTTFLKALLADPSATFDDLMVRATPSLHRRFAAFRSKVAVDGAATTKHFFDMDPLSGVTLHEPPAFARLSQRFEKFEAQLYERFAKRHSETKPEEENG